MELGTHSKNFAVVVEYHGAAIEQRDRLLVPEKLAQRKADEARYRYFDLDRWTYWTMGAPAAITIIINRRRADDIASV